MTYLMVRHKVADFDQWKQVFDSHAEAQGASGVVDPPDILFLS